MENDVKAILSNWNSTKSNLNSAAMTDKKPYAKIDPIGKLHIIYSLDNGQSKTDIARQYGVPIKTITYIYRQKEIILKKYTQKYNQLKQVRCVNLDQTLLDWLKVQISNQNPVTEENLLNKAREIIQHISEEFTYIHDWLLDFQLRHNIVKYTSQIQHSVESSDEWKKIMNQVDPKELYVSGTCALSHSFSIESYAAGEQPNDYMSVFFIVHTLGYCQRKLAVVGKEHLIAQSNIGSLPVNYYCNNGQINQHAILNYLNEWDIELSTGEKTVFLVLNIPENSYLASIQFNKIRIIKAKMGFLSHTLEKIEECFKYHYRKIQISRKIEHGNDLYLGYLDYINMMSLAWFNVPASHMKQIFYQPKEGNLYLRVNDSCDGNHSLLQWCQMYNVPLSLQLYAHCLDEFILCDKKLKSIDFEDSAEAFELNTNPRPASGMEAYQAMKRLLSYVQEESASDCILDSAKHLENHLEYGALSEIHKIVAGSRSE